MSDLVAQLYSLKNSKKKALTIVNGDSFTYRQIFNYAFQIETYFRKEGLGGGERVLLLIEPGLQAVCVTLACLRLGISVVLIDPESSGQEVFKQKIKTAKPTCIVLDYRLKLLANHPIARFLLEKTGKRIPSIPDLKSYKLIVNKKIPFFHNTLPGFDQTFPKKNVQISDVPEQNDALIVFTSGTTLTPKAVVHTHKSLKLSLDVLGSFIKHPKIKLYTNQIYFLFFAMAMKAEVVFEPNKFNAESFVKNSQRHKPNMTFAPPSELMQVIRYCRSNKQHFPQSYDHLLLGSAPATKGFLKKLFASNKKKIKTTCLYGMTEVLPISYVDGHEKLERKIDGDLLGKPAAGVKLKIDNNDVLHVRAKHLCDRYIDMAKHSSVSTCDIVGINKKNEIILKGRQKDMILRRSFNIYPALYEPIIESIPEIDVACLVGIYDRNIEDERVVLALETDQQINLNSIMKKLTSGKYSIDQEALPDEIVSIKIPRSGRQKKIDKQSLREQLLKS